MITKLEKAIHTVVDGLLCFSIMLGLLSQQVLPIMATEHFPTVLKVLSGTGAIVKQGVYTAYWYDGIGKIEVNGNIAFCVEPTTIGLTGPYHLSQDDWSEAVRKQLSLIVYYGWDQSKKSDDDYAATQYLVWETLGASIEQWYGDFGNRYATIKSSIQQKIAAHDKKPSFDGNHYEATVNEPLVLNDTNQILAQYHVKSSDCDVQIQGNQLTITPKESSAENSTIVLQKEWDRSIGANLIYRSSVDGQSVGVFRLASAVQTKISLTVHHFGTFKLKKVDEEGNPVPNTSFQFSYQEDMSNPIGIATTGSDGWITLERLLPQKLYYQEVRVPAPLVIDKRIHSTLVVANRTVEETTMNYFQRAKITLVKEDAETGSIPQGDASLEGAVYELKAKSDIINPFSRKVIYQAGSCVAKRITKKDGSCDWVEQLYPGRYEWVEIESPKGYLKNREAIEVDLSYQGSDTVAFSKKSVGKDQVIKGRHKIFKTATTTKPGSGLLSPLAGAQFTYKLLSEVEEKGWEQARSYDVITSDENGFAQTNWLPYGIYYVKETYTPSGKLAAPDFTVSLVEDGKTIFHAINNAPYQAYVRLIKEENNGKRITLSQASFQIYDDQDQLIVQNVGGKEISLFTTDQNGEVTTPLTLMSGKYYIKEIQAPKGYLKLKEPLSFTIDDHYDYDHNKIPTLTLTIPNEKPMARIVVEKQLEREEKEGLQKICFRLITGSDIVDPSDGSLLYAKGARITIGADQDGLYHVQEDGTLVIEGLPISLGKTTYFLQEVASLDGYVVEDQMHAFDFEMRDATTKVYEQSKTIKNSLTTVEIEKCSWQGEAIKGAQMIVKDHNGNVIDEWISDGTHQMKGLHINERYTLCELSAPKGYVVSKEMEFTVRNERDVQKVVMIDKQVGVIKWEKNTHQPLLQAEFKVIDPESREVLDHWISDGSVHFISHLQEGKQYELVEISAPKGYEAIKPILFQVSDEKATQYLYVDNQAIPVVKTSDTHSPARWLSLLFLSIGGMIYYWQKKEGRKD